MKYPVLPRIREGLALLAVLPLIFFLAACSSQDKTAEVSQSEQEVGFDIRSQRHAVSSAKASGDVAERDAEKKIAADETGPLEILQNAGTDDGVAVQSDEATAPASTDAAVTTPRIADDAVRSDKILDLSSLNITTEDIGVTTPKIVDAAVITSPVVALDGSGNPVQWPANIPNANPVAPQRLKDVLNASIGQANRQVDRNLNVTIREEDLATGAVNTEEVLSETILASDISSEVVEAVKGDLPLDPRNNNNDVQQRPERKPSVENMFRATAISPYSTFSIDVDNASYTNVRGYLTRGQLPPPDAVRIEELVNYFEYNYGEPTDEHPFAFHSEVTECPWNSDHRLLRLALQGKDLHPEQAPPSNLVFLVDVSGSMRSGNKLPLLKQGFEKLVGQLRSRDRVAVVVYAGAAGQVLESTPGSEKFKILGALGRLKAGGSTAGGAGIELAYKVAKENFIANGNNRVILATDGDFNVGVSSNEGLVKLIEEKRKDGIFLSVLGFGSGNYQDTKMERLADNGNGNYFYIDQLKEAERVLVSEMSGTLHTIAKDVKLQIKFNPEKIQANRLIGYENRVLAARDFDDDTKDAGELGAGHRVTALYEIVPVGSSVGYDVEQSKIEDYQIDEKRPELLTANDVLLARLRYKEPKDSVSKLIEHIVPDNVITIEKATQGTRFAAAVAQWGMLLRGSAYSGTGSYDRVISLGTGASGKDPDGYRKEFIDLVKQSRDIALREGLAGSR